MFIISYRMYAGVCGRVTPVDVIRAVFPGGTITGCPKVRCMEIIAELESKAVVFIPVLLVTWGLTAVWI